MITSSYPRSAGDGAGSFVRSLSQELVRSGQEVHVVAPYDPAIGQGCEDGVQVHRFHYAPTDRLSIMGHGRALEADTRLKAAAPLLVAPFVTSALLQTLRLHRTIRFDVFHAHWAVPGGVIGALASYLTGVPLVISLHGSDVFVIEHNRIYALAARMGFGRARAVISCSQDLSERATRLGLDATLARVIPYGVDGTRFAAGHAESMRRKLRLPESAIVLGALGRLVHKKGFAHLIEAMPMILTRCPNAYCVIGGDGDLRPSLQEQAARLALDGRVLFPGHIPWEDTPDFYALCDVFVLPSVIDPHGNVDGLPNVLLEAMAAQRAIVASQVGGIPAVVRDGHSGILTPPGDAASLAAAVLRLLEDPNLRHHLGINAMNQARESLGWDVAAGRMERVYAEALSTRGFTANVA